MYKIIYKYKAEFLKSKLGEKRTVASFKTTHKDAYLVLDTDDNTIMNITHSQLSKIAEILGVDMNSIDRSYLTQLNAHRLMKVCHSYEIPYQDIKEITVEHFDNKIDDADLMFRGILEGKAYDTNLIEISNDKTGMQKCYMYLGNNGVLHFLTSAKFIMLPKDVDTMRFLFCDTSCVKMNLSDFIFDPETNNASCMFTGNSKLEELNIEGLDFCNISQTRDMFRNCSELKHLKMNTEMGRMHDLDKYEYRRYNYHRMYTGLVACESLDFRFIDYSRLKLADTVCSAYVYYSCQSMWLYSNKVRYNTVIIIPLLLKNVSKLYVNADLFKLIKQKRDKCFYNRASLKSLEVLCYKNGTDEVTDTLHIEFRGMKKCTN